MEAGSAAAWVRPLAALLLVIACSAVGMASLAPGLHILWTDPFGAFSHGYLVVVLSVWLSIHYWREAPPERLAPWPPALLLIIALLLARASMEVMFINSARFVLIPFILLASIAFVFGRGAARTLLWPILYLLFALPQWWPLNSVLQSITSKVVGLLVDATNLPAYVEGNFIQVPAGMIEVATGCSGLNYFISALALAGFYAFMYLKRWRNRGALLLAAAVMACLSNWIRVSTIVVLGIVTDMQHYLVRVDHLYFGWVLFLVLMIPVLWLGRRLEDAEAPAESSEEVASATSRPTSIVPLTSGSVLPVALAAGFVLALPAFVSVANDGASKVVAELPESFGPWVRQGDVNPAWTPSFVNAVEEQARYVRAGQAIDLFRASYPHQSFDARLIRGENDFFGRAWRLAEQTAVTPNASSVGEVIESRGYVKGEEHLIWTWYVVAGEPAATKVAAKLQELRGIVQRRRDASAFAISAQCIPDCEAARERLEGFMQQSAASLQ